MINRMQFYLRFILFIFLLASALTALAVEVSAVRLNDGKPIITRKMFELAGAAVGDGMNINGPSLIKVPEWLKKNGKVVHKDANYYLYFAHHEGKYIRLAWSRELEGPWHLHGVKNPEGQRGVLDLGEKSRIDLSPSLAIHSHIASPDVFVDDQNKMIRMYFHAPVLIKGKPVKEQKSLVASSADGLNFNLNDSSKGLGIYPFVLGRSYFRVFQWRNETYAVSGGGFLFKNIDKNANDIRQNNNFQTYADLWQRREYPLLPAHKDADGIDVKPRHSTVKAINNELWVFYTRTGDNPEHILLSRIDIGGDWFKWKEKYSPLEVLKPQLKWEGAGYESRPSKKGPGIQERALRDPYVYEEAGKYYLLYSGAGEEAIGLARLHLEKQ
jgi:hypothetical protein